MQFTIPREILLKPLQRVTGALEKRQTLPILANVLMIVEEKRLSLIATDLEIEVITHLPLTDSVQEGKLVVSGKKLMDICKALPEQAMISFEMSDQKVLIKALRSRYVLACSASDHFPRMTESALEVELTVSQATLRQLLEYTSFAMAQQDVRYYLNGLCWIFSDKELRVVATDGHRLATLALPIEATLAQSREIVIPRKAVLEMQRLFLEGDEQIGLVMAKNHLRVVMSHSTFVTKLIEGKFPDYRRVFPQQSGHQLVVLREAFKQVLLRVSALFSDKYRGVGLRFSPQTLHFMVVTSDKDEVEEQMSIDYEGPVVEIGFNASYLLEYLNIIKSDHIRIHFMAPEQVVLFKADEKSHDYIVMPMRL